MQAKSHKQPFHVRITLSYMNVWSTCTFSYLHTMYVLIKHFSSRNVCWFFLFSIHHFLLFFANTLFAVVWKDGRKSLNEHCKKKSSSISSLQLSNISFEHHQQDLCWKFLFFSKKRLLQQQTNWESTISKMLHVFLM